MPVPQHLDINHISKTMNIAICKVCDLLVKDPWPEFDVRVCNWDGDHPICTQCKLPMIGMRWRGEICRDCHEDLLLPETDYDRWEAHFAD